MRSFRNILVVVKQTPYEQYLQMKNQGKAPIALRWERLKNRYEVHRQCVDKVIDVLKKESILFSVIGRDELHRGLVMDKDLIIAVGGDGTILNASSFLDDTIPILGVNSDPTRPDEKLVTKQKDERRSRGALCAMTANDVAELLPRVLHENIEPNTRTRIQCLVRSSYTETRLPPALNDVLIAHPSPASVSRFRLSLANGNVTPSYKTVQEHADVFSINVWSSGIWICTSTGSTAAMHAAGGFPMSISDPSLQYMVREHLVEDGSSDHKQRGHGLIGSDQMLCLRWNSGTGGLFVDGAHMQHPLELGDEIKIDGHAPLLKIFDKLPSNESE